MHFAQSQKGADKQQGWIKRGMNKRNLKRLLMVAPFMLLLLVGWTVGAALLGGHEKQVAAAGGTLDMRQLDFDDIYFLNADKGGWDTYSMQLYTPQQLAEITEKPPLVPRSAYSEDQYFTHRITLYLPQGQTYGISMRTADYAMRIFLNGEELGAAGWPAQTDADTVPRVLEKTYFFTPNTEKVEIVIQTANFNHADGGWVPSIYIGLSDAVAAKNQKDLIVSVMILGFLMSAFAYHFGLFCINPSRRPALFLALGCLALLVQNNRLVPIFFPNYNWHVVIRLEYCAVLFAYISLCCLMRAMYPKQIHKLPLKLFIAVCAAYALLVLTTDTVFFTRFVIVLQVAAVIMILYMIICLARGLRLNDLGRLLSFAGFLVLCIFGLNDILYHFGIIVWRMVFGQSFLAPIGMVFFILCFGLSLSLEFSKTEQALAEGRRHIAEVEARYQAIQNEANARAPKAVFSGFGLSQRETDVAWLLIDGASRVQIADALGISLGSVNTYCSRIYQKTSCASPADLLRSLNKISR